MAYSHHCVKMCLWLNAIMSQDQDKFIARLPDGLRERLKTVAERNKRSMNAELVQALEYHLGSEEHAVEFAAAQEAWLKDPDYVPPEFPQLANPGLPATKGDIERLLIAFEKAIGTQVYD
jgi:plasmid stability protein